MGLIANVLLLPVLGPVRGVTWVAEVIFDEAGREMATAASPARTLEDLAAAVANGEVSPAEAEAREAEIIERMLAGHGAPEGP
jgi:hypothetical protein